MMTIEPPRNAVLTADSWGAWGLSRAGLSRFAHAAQVAVGLVGGVDVLLAGDSRLRKLNREFRGKDKATDVLSFPAAAGFGDGHAGDLAISLETARRQAAAYGHSLRDEVRVLLLHGMLHLAGMDHEVDAGEMGEREAELRVRLRLPNGLIGRVDSALEPRLSPGAKAAGSRSEKRAKAKALAYSEAKARTDAKARSRVKIIGSAKAKAGLNEPRATSLEGRGKTRSRSSVSRRMTSSRESRLTGSTAKSSGRVAV